LHFGLINTSANCFCELPFSDDILNCFALWLLLLSQVILLQNLSAALSACIYQCLCDSDRFVVSVTDSVSVGMEGFTSTSVVYRDSYLMAGVQNRHRLSSSDNTDLPTSLPAKWPGVLLASSHDHLPIIIICLS